MKRRQAPKSLQETKKAEHKGTQGIRVDLDVHRSCGDRVSPQRAAAQGRGPISNQETLQRRCRKLSHKEGIYEDRGRKPSLWQWMPLGEATWREEGQVQVRREGCHSFAESIKAESKASGPRPSMAVSGLGRVKGKP